MDRDSQNPVRLPTPSAAARARLLSLPLEPLFIADWLNVVMIHLEVDAKALQAVVPFTLDLWKGRAFVSLVAFTMRGMHPRFGGRLGKLLLRPIASHHFLNLRTYVRHGDESGIHFMAEWLNSRLAVQLGPRAFGLPYQFGRMNYANEAGTGELRGEIRSADGQAAICYWGRVADQSFRPCAKGSIDEWLMERYTAFNSGRGRRRFFRVWHESWPQVPAQVELTDRSLLARHWPFLSEARLVGANHSPGVRDVWMGWPHRIHGESVPGLILNPRTSR